MKKDTGKPMKKQQNQNELLSFPSPPSFLSSFSPKILDVFLDLDENSTIFSLFSLQISSQISSIIIEFFLNTAKNYYFSDISLKTINKYDTFLLAGSSDGEILLWDLRNHKENSNFHGVFTDRFPKEIILKNFEFLYLPIRRLSFINSSMNMSTNGRNAAFAACDNNMTMIRFIFGTIITPAPMMIRAVNKK